MGFSIVDGTGTGDQARVSPDHRVDVSSRTNPRIAYRSKNEADSYTWTSAFDHDAGDTILLLSNASTTKKIYVHAIFIGADTATEWLVHIPTYPTLAGTTITGVNTNLTSGNVADAEAYGDETGNTTGTTLASGFVGGNATIALEPSGSIILGYHHCIAVDLVTAGTRGTTTIAGYFE